MLWVGVWKDNVLIIIVGLTVPCFGWLDGRKMY